MTSQERAAEFKKRWWNLSTGGWSMQLDEADLAEAFAACGDAPTCDAPVRKHQGKWDYHGFEAPCGGPGAPLCSAHLAEKEARLLAQTTALEAECDRLRAELRGLAKWSLREDEARAEVLTRCLKVRGDGSPPDAG